MTTTLSPRAWRVGVLASIVTLAVIAPLTPLSAPRQVIARGAGIAGLVVYVVVLRRMTGRLRRTWLGMGGYLLCTVVADVIYDIQLVHLGDNPFPGVTDPLYLLAYVFAIVGLLDLGHAVSPRRGLEAWIDALLLTVAVGSFVGALVIGPIIEDSGRVDLATVISVAYPVLDLLLLAALLRLIVLRFLWNVGLTLLSGALAMFVASDVYFNYQALSGDWVEPAWTEVLWSAAVLLMVIAAAAPGADQMRVVRTSRDDDVTVVRAASLGAAVLSVPSVVTWAVWTHRYTTAGWLAPLVLIVVLLLLWRAYRLLRTVQGQARELEALARTDPLTGVPNRRTWEFEVRRSLQRTRAAGEPLSVALVDIDHFKMFNDAFGHQAGDEFLIEATRSWRRVLGDADVLARYGGEEFGLLLPGSTVQTAMHMASRLKAATPAGQTVSIGLAEVRDGEDVQEALRRADEALYVAKARGRDCAVNGDGLLDPGSSL